MKQSKLLLLLVISIVLLLVTACAGGAPSQTESVRADEPAVDEHMAGNGHHDSDDHDDVGSGMDHTHVETPHEFEDLSNPVAGDHEALEAGEETFNTLCATCHGAEGKGDGPGAAELDPKPADLSDGMMMSELSDGYLFWRVSKGGMQEPFNSAMPAWENGLTDEQRWQVISYVRTLSVDHDGQEENHSEDDHGDDGHDD